MHHTPTPPHRHTTLSVVDHNECSEKMQLPTLESRTDSCCASLTHKPQRNREDLLCCHATASAQSEVKSVCVCVGGHQEKQGPWTHCETNADSGSEGPWDELALVVLN